MDAEDAYIDGTKPVCDDAPQVMKGSQPTDGGNLSKWSDARRAEVIAQYPVAKSLFHRITGSEESINGVVRWCLWLKNASPAVIRAVPPVMDAVARVREMRLASSKAATRKWADKPTLFTEDRHPESGNYLLIPRHSSENRKYIPMSFLPAEVITNDSALIIPNATLYNFGVITSLVHMAWTRTTCGRIKSDYRYSAKVVYNSFVWPTVTDEMRERISATAQGILDARAAHPDCTLADLYDPLAMPPDLRASQEANDRAVLAAYGLAPDTPEPEIVAHLFKLYAAKTAK